MNYLGIDVGGTSIKAGVVNDAGQVVDQTHIPTARDSWDDFLRNLIQLINGYKATHSIQAIGMGVPGFHNSRTREMVASPNIPALLHAKLEETVAAAVGLPVISENDANAAAYAEFVCGAGVGLQHMAFLTLGTGFGSGLILNGKLFTGTSGYAAEFGHTIIQPDGRHCACGSYGCIETVASATGILATALEMMASAPASLLHTMTAPLTSEMVFDAAKAGDDVAVKTFQQTGRWLGMACTNLINLLNLQMIVFGGGVMAGGDHLMNPLLEAVGKYAISASRLDCQIVQSRLWPETGVIGAAMLARDR
jgi:glucokinase